ncbi:hypothetical protein DFJ58DRAFT_807727 [Suillus subalutaceus]|uniref:uncharacterized protein n=1 Tax=Suillus subalutaceus TaxID=48586 RepID=UPI001B860EA6|nr:uncharacterized protein DFJ58DRAFT_807727 [Suillus subalutaceus]KAG1841824.1 hypothetical protein DFJ58DRAFT_807727 [Suillus subalutaceus]
MMRELVKSYEVWNSTTEKLDHIVIGRWHPSLTESPPVPPTGSFLKRPCILLPDDYDSDEPEKPGVWTPGDYLVKEAKVYEILKQHPHPNISTMDADPTLNHAAILDGVSKGLTFLHETLGLVHNDINPANIALDDAGDPVIIDFDSCIPIGEAIGLSSKAGTPGWTMEPMPTIALPENDIYGLEQIGEFMKGKRS